MKIILMILLLSSQLFAQVVLSEVMYNESGSRIALEWVEIYNQADTVVNLNNYIFVSGALTDTFPNNATVPPSTYAILAKKLIARDSTDSFEGHWGDSSGYWGDSPLENYRAFPARMELSNTSGTIYLIKKDSSFSDQCAWNGPAADGQSLERDQVNPPTNSWHLSNDSTGSTPGRRNSEAATPGTTESLVLSSRLFSPSKGEHLQIDYTIPVACQITLEIFDDSGRKQITLVDKVLGSGQTIWDGKARDSSRLPPGIYLLLSTLSGNQNCQKNIPVVIAP